MAALKHWLQINQVFDPNLLDILPEYGINDPDNDLTSLSEDKWTECRAKLMSDKRADLKDNAALNRYKKKLDKIQRIWKEKRKKDKGLRNTESSKTKRKRSSVSKSNALLSHEDVLKELDDLRMENRKIRRELSSKNSDYNRLQQEFTAYKVVKDEEVRKWSAKYRLRHDEYEKLLKSYKQINQRVNSKYHDQSAKDKVIEMLKSDKSTLLDDVTTMMAAENEKYNVLLDKYEALKRVNNRNLKYKAKYKRRKKRDSLIAQAVLQKEDEWDHEHGHTRSVTGIDLDDLEYDEYGVDHGRDGGDDGGGVSSTMSPSSLRDDDWDDIGDTVSAPVIRKHTKGAQSMISVGSPGAHSRPKKFKPKPKRRNPGKSKNQNGRSRSRAQSVNAHSSLTLQHYHTASQHRATVSSNRALRTIGNASVPNM